MEYICDRPFIDNKCTRSEHELIRACIRFRSDHEEELEQWLTQRDPSVPLEKFVNDVCGPKTYACFNVDVGSLTPDSVYFRGHRNDGDSELLMSHGPQQEEIDNISEMIKRQPSMQDQDVIVNYGGQADEL